ncbi:MAG: DNA primase [Muribaculaceae bacterium]|nr:DNA primase [Muribaculaceae bacterium]
MIDKATVQRIKDTANIVEVVSDYVHLTRRGANYMGLCPFHNERTPSFSVNPRRNICHCFSCGKGGSPVNFIMEKEGISYYDALKQLAKKYGIKVEERELTPEERRLATEREGMLIAAEAAMKQMEEDLIHTDEGRDIGISYLYGRGVTDEAIKAFHLGYALDKGNHLTGILQRQGFDITTLRSLGITGVSKAGNNYDKYRGRVIFPIMNSSGKVVGFGGRDLKGGPAKYINSPESVLYHKNNELYGIYQAKNEIVRQGRCYLVEGYLDVISMWQSGLKNVVASSGTALTDGQIATIHRFAPNITLVYDGDAAGIKAALRGIDMLLSHKLKVSVLLLPDGHDPDSFARANTPEQFREYVEQHSCDIIRFKMDVLMKDAGDDPQKKASVVGSVVDSIACIPDGVERTVYVGECARIMHLDEAAVAAAVERSRIKVIEQQKQERRRREAERLYPISSDSAVETSNASNPTSTGVPATGINPLSDSSDTNPSQSPEELTQEQNFQSATDATTPLTAPLVSGNPDPLLRQISRKVSADSNPMVPFEKRVIELLIKYGYLIWDTPIANEGEQNPEICSYAEPVRNVEEYYSILDFVGEVLEADKFSFSVPAYAKVFNALLSALDDYFPAYNNRLDKIKAEIEVKRRQRHEEIAAKVATMADIQREERKLEQSLLEELEQQMQEFARFYPGDILASHEDADVRKIATAAISEKYILSNIFVKNGGNNDVDESELVDRALAEWKSEILNQMIIEMMSELRLLSSAIDTSDFSQVTAHYDEPMNSESCLMRMQDLQGKITSKMMLRSKVAKDLGDRILNTRRR